MNRTLLFLAFSLGSMLPLCAGAAIDPSTIPDGTYTVTVAKVVDAKHVDVQINGGEAMLTAGRPSVDFSKVQPNDQLKLSLISGAVVVYADLTTH